MDESTSSQVRMLIKEQPVTDNSDFQVGCSSPSLDVRAQLESMRSMQDGWLEGGGVAPSVGGLDWLEEAFARHFPEGSPRPYLYPTEAGGVQAEWSLSPWRVALEIDLQSRCGNWFALNLETDDVDERRLRCDEASDWQWLVRRIHRLSRGLA